MKVLVTGAAGFIGMHCSTALLARGDEVIGLDNLNEYYDVSLKHARLQTLTHQDGFSFVKGDIADEYIVQGVFKKYKPDRVLHLAAQAGVRHSLEHPQLYAQSNLVGFLNILEGCRQASIQHLVYASSSSVYGANKELPFSESDNVDHPVSLYAATKKSNELMAHAYCHLYGFPVTGLRYFTVYGPWGRPDMSPWLFTSAIMEGRGIKIFNNGEMQRDFTYVDDIVEGSLRALDTPPTSGNQKLPYVLYNIGNHQPVPLMSFVESLENAIGRSAKKSYHPMQPGDMAATYANTERLQQHTGFKPSIPLSTGLERWVAWYNTYHDF